ncbi:glutamate-5-semialdehyde dehydrogenase [Lachnospiraceae bacterium KH1T2]|nr:glutamate-5-semialdehyde dehydrogenase [Lachnospiraceae bacterium KH1T2]
MNAQLIEIGKKAKKAAYIVGKLSTDDKNRGLRAAAAALVDKTQFILDENAKDVLAARNKVSQAMLDRLSLDEKRVEAMALGLRQVADLQDPIDSLVETITRPNGLVIEKRKVPLGVIAIIYESRPNVTADSFALCFKSGNAVILRGGSDALRSNAAIAKVIRNALNEAGLPEDAVQVVEDTSHETANELMRLNGYVDLLIPRGGAGLIKAVVKNSTVPTIETGVGNCHIFVDETADIDMAVKIIDNAKTQRMGVCNAAESLVIHSGIIEKALPEIFKDLHEKGVTVRGDERAKSIVDECEAATEEDFAAEYLGPFISVKTIDSLDEAIEHINRFTTHHSEAIITNSEENSKRFLREIDAAAVYVNASTRFTDGFEFGFGAEIGISTQKFHARGPMGLDALTSYKYEIKGNGQIRG